MAEPSLVSRQECESITQKCFQTPTTPTITNFTLQPFRNQFQGLVGEHLTLSISHKTADGAPEVGTNYFLKKLSSNPRLERLSKELLLFEKEALYYSLLDDFRGYEIDAGFAPKGYHFARHTVVIEDLGEAGFRGTPKRELLDEEHCRKCLQAIARFHASSILYERKKSKELGMQYRLLDEFPAELNDQFAGAEEGIAAKWFKNSVQGVFCLIDLILDAKEADEMKEQLNVILAMADAAQPGLLNAILHNDLWTSNLLYRYDSNNQAVCAKIIDFQTITYGPIELDLLKFFMTSTSAEFRTANLIRLLEFYFDCLKAALDDGEALLAVEKGAFLASCLGFQLAGKLHAVVDHSFTFMADEVFAEVLQDEAKFQEFFLDQRAKFVRESWERNDKFREILTADVLELKGLLS